MLATTRLRASRSRLAIQRKGFVFYRGSIEERIYILRTPAGGGGGKKSEGMDGSGEEERGEKAPSGCCAKLRWQLTIIARPKRPCAGNLYTPYKHFTSTMYVSQLVLATLCTLTGALARPEHISEIWESSNSTKEMVSSPRPHEYINKGDIPDNFDWGNQDGKSMLTMNLNQHIPQVRGEGDERLEDYLELGDSSSRELSLYNLSSPLFSILTKLFITVLRKLLGTRFPF